MAITRSVKTRVQVNIEAIEIIDPGDGGSPTVKVHPFAYDETFLSGNGSAQFDRVYSDYASSSTAMDFSDAILDAGGTALSCTKLGLIAVKCLGTSTTDVCRVGEDAASAPFMGAPGDFAIIGAKGLYLQVSPITGWTLAAGTADIVDVNHTTGTWDHQVLVVGKT